MSEFVNAMDNELLNPLIFTRLNTSIISEMFSMLSMSVAAAGLLKNGNDALHFQRLRKGGCSPARPACIRGRSHLDESIVPP